MSPVNWAHAVTATVKQATRIIPNGMTRATLETAAIWQTPRSGNTSTRWYFQRGCILRVRAPNPAHWQQAKEEIMSNNVVTRIDDIDGISTSTPSVRTIPPPPSTPGAPAAS